MRARSTLLVVAILLVAGFAALNWSEIVRTSPLSFGVFVTDAPLGAILLALLAITLVLFLAATAAMRTQSLMDYRSHQKTLEAQRELAEKAEASRFVDLRRHMDEHLNRLGERDSLATTEFDKAMAEHRRDLQAQVEQIGRMLSARFNELENRLDSRLGPVNNTIVPPVMRNEPVQPVVHENVVREQDHAMAREEERLRDERIREERELRREERPVDRPNESGWRKWF